MNVKKLLVISPILAMLCFAMFASIVPQAQASTLGRNGYLASIIWAQTGPRGYGDTDSEGYLTGSGPDGYYAHIWGGNPGDGGVITGEMNVVVDQGANVKIYGYSVSGYYSDVYVYVASSINGPYQQVDVKQTFSYTEGTHWEYYFNAPIGFKYISIAGYDSANSVNVYLDCVISY